MNRLNTEKTLIPRVLKRIYYMYTYTMYSIKNKKIEI